MGPWGGLERLGRHLMVWQPRSAETNDFEIRPSRAWLVACQRALAVCTSAPDFPVDFFFAWALACPLPVLGLAAT